MAQDLHSLLAQPSPCIPSRPRDRELTGGCVGTHNGDDLLNATSFPEMDYALGAPHGKAQETEPGSNVWRRAFASGTVATWDNNKKTGSVAWAGR